MATRNYTDTLERANTARELEFLRLWRETDAEGQACVSRIILAMRSGFELDPSRAAKMGRAEIVALADSLR